jgi:hypothetical protein
MNGARTCAAKLALGAAETRRLLTHPLVLLGGAAAFVAAIAWLWNGQRSDVVTIDSSPIVDFGGQLNTLSLILGPATLFAGNLSASRERRGRTGELLTACPTGARARTLAALVAVVAVGVATLLLSALISLSYTWLGAAPARWPTPAELAVQPIGVLGAGLLGVMTARWMPWPGAAFAVLIVIYSWCAVGLVLVPTTDTWAELAPYYQMYWQDQPGDPMRYFAGSVPWHDGYLLCLGAMAAIGALLATPGPRRTLLLSGAGAVVAAAVTGWLQLP